jgi:predicted amidohydrolase YtcJ
MAGSSGVTTDTPQPEGGVIERDERGELHGIIRERQAIVGRLVPAATAAEVRDSLVRTHAARMANIMARHTSVPRHDWFEPFPSDRARETTKAVTIRVIAVTIVTLTS